MTSTDPEPLSVKIAAQITPRMEHDLRALMAAEGIDLSTAIRAAIKVGLDHPSAISQMAKQDQAERARRVRATAAEGGRRGMASRKRQAMDAELGLVRGIAAARQAEENTGRQAAG